MTPNAISAANEAASPSQNSSATEVVASGIAARTQPGHSVVLEEIWQTHAKQILRVTQRITNNREDAEDALQDSFLRAHVHLHDFDGRSSLLTWLTRIAINSALMILRKRVRSPQLSTDDATNSGTDASFLTPVDPSPSPEDQYRQTEQQARLRRAIGTLRPTARQVLELQTLEKRSVKEIAEKLGLSIAATKSRLFHAKNALRKALSPEGFRRSPRTKRLQLSPA